MGRQTDRQTERETDRQSSLTCSPKEEVEDSLGGLAIPLAILMPLGGVVNPGGEGIMANGGGVGLTERSEAADIVDTGGRI